MIILSKTFDDGVICGSESSPVVVDAIYDVFVTGAHDRIAVFGPESARSERFFEQAGTAADGVHKVIDEGDLERLNSDVPLVLLPLWWKEATSAAVISGARFSHRKILTAFPG